jgi:hypothetical protein
MPWLWGKKTSTCAYWDCCSKVPEGEFLCAQHKEKWQLGLIDRCPDCGRFKDVMYYQCQDCHYGLKPKSKQLPDKVPEPPRKISVKYTESRPESYLSGERRFVFIIGFEDGHQSIGLTKDMKKHLNEIKKLKKKGEENPGLDYLEIVAGQAAAEMRVVEIQDIARSNPRQIVAMTLEFHHHMKEFGFEKG